MKTPMRRKTAYFTILGCMMLLAGASALHAQGKLENASCGRIVNGGKITVRGTVNSVTGANIDNARGLFIIGDDAVIQQPEIAGRVEYIKDIPNANQRIPQIRHKVVYFSGVSSKMLDTNYNGANFVSIDTIYTSPEANIIIDRNFPLISLGRVTHNGTVGRGLDFGEFILNGTSAQNVDGTGVFNHLTMDNSQDIYVINNGGFGVKNALYLKNGVFRNNDTNNLRMLEASMIIRNDVATIANHPLFQRWYSVKYIGTNGLTTANEIPVDTTALKTLTVENRGGLTLSRNVFVNDSLNVGTASDKMYIYTDVDTNNKHFLAFTPRDNQPNYVHPKSEVVGSFKRTSLRADNTAMLFNNIRTYVEFASATDMGAVSEMTIDSRNMTFPSQPDGDKKAKRSIHVTAASASGESITDNISYRLGYGWCNYPTDPTLNESNGLDITKVNLQRWNTRAWENVKGSKIPAQTDANNWAYSYADTVRKTGFFAIGLPIPSLFALQAKVLMEGPYRYGSMTTDLLAHNLIPTTPANIYPYNLDATRDTTQVASIPEGVVDWVVVELRKTPSSSDRFYRTGFLKESGNIVGLDGQSTLTFPHTLDTGSYYVVIHHRNHLAVMSANPMYLQTVDDILSIYDFTQPANVLGGSDAMKVVDCTDGDALIFAMVGGDTNGDGVIDDTDRRDYDSDWNNRDKEEYINQDTDMSGIVTTRDANKTWNNRKRHTNVPR